MAALTATRKTLTKKPKPRARKPSRKKEKPRFIDGSLEFKSKVLFEYHLHLKHLKQAGFIQSFEVPVIKDMKNTGRIRAVKIMIDGVLFDSMTESKYYLHLLEKKNAGDIKNFSLQPVYTLQESFKKFNVTTKKMKTIRKVEYIADFLVTDNNNETVIYDVKGILTDVFKLKRKWFDHVFPNLQLVCVKYNDKTDEWIAV